MNQSDDKSLVAQALLTTLDKIDRPGSFCTHGSLPLVLPGLEVKDVGPIGLPLTKKQARQLLKQCEQAPFGKGEETLVDTDVRRVWQLEPGQFKLANPQFQGFVEEITKSVQHELGLEKQKLKSHLYKLLVYEKGDFFVAHRDTEKIDRMVATLVIVLPSAHEGGELVVRHNGDECVIDFGGNQRHFEVQYAAFYADCRHEIRPVHSGYRLCLVYNLALAGRQQAPRAPKTGAYVAEISGTINEWKQQPDSEKLAIVLDHEYTEKGLEFSKLKGLDRAKAQVVLEAARQVSCQAYLALLTLWESGYPEYTGYSEDDYEMAEVFDSGLAADHWTDIDGTCRPFGEISFDQSEIVIEGQLQDVDPEEDYQEYTGNEGATLERWYRHAAIVLWPTERHFQVLCDAGIPHALSTLEEMVAGDKKSTSRSEKSAARQQCVAFAEQIVAAWPDSSARYYPDSSKQSDCQRLINILKTLKEPSLTRSLLSQVLPKDDSPISASAVVALCTPLGWTVVGDALVELFQQTQQSTLERNASLLEAICLLKERDEDQLSVCGKLAKQMVEAVKRCDSKRETNRWNAPKVDRVKLLDSVCKSLFTLDDHESLDALVKHVTSKPKKYPRTDVQIATIQRLRPWMLKETDHDHPSLTPWIRHCIEQLETATVKPPKEPSNWRQIVKLSCSCEDCSQLSTFLKDPQEQVHRFRVRKDRRHHLHTIIDKHHCDLTHVTDRRGSPQTLVCTKTRATYEAALKQYQLDVEHLAELRELCDELDP